MPVNTIEPARRPPLAAAGRAARRWSVDRRGRAAQGVRLARDLGQESIRKLS